MKLGITGAATYQDYAHFQRVVQAIPVPITLIVTGGRDGVEKMARRYAREHELSVLIHNKKTDCTIDWMKAFDLLLASDADNLLAFQYPGTQTCALLKWAAKKTGKRLNTVYLEPNTDEQPEALPHSIASRYGEDIC